MMDRNEPDWCGNVTVNLPKNKNASNDNPPNIHIAPTVNKPVINNPVTYKPIIFNIYGTEIGQPSVSNQTRPPETKIPKIMELKEMIQQHYQLYTLPKVAWLEKGEDLDLENFFVKLELHDSGQSINLKNIFQPIDSKKPLRILIESQPGYGKTTLATKLAFDWAKGKEYIKFELVFFIRLRELQKQTFEEAIEQLAQRCGYKEKDVIEIIEKNEDDVLFILDGFDELVNRHEINQILYKNKYRKVTVVLLCRSGFSTLTEEDRVKLSGVPNIRNKYYDKHITMLGIKEWAEKKRFLQKFLDDGKISDLENLLSTTLQKFDSPLLLMSLPIIMLYGINILQLKTRTMIYKQLFNCVIKHSYRNRGLDLHSNFEIFRFDSSTNNIQNHLCQFGIKCIDKIVSRDLQFKSDNLTEEIYKLGLLAKNTETTIFDSRDYYEAFHLTFLEFAAAFALWFQLKFDKSTYKENSLKAIVIRFFDSKRTSQILPFLASLMDSDLDCLLKQLTPYAFLFCLDIDSTCILLSDCPADIISESSYLENFINSELNLCRRYFSYHHQDKWKELLKCKKIQKIVIDENTPSSIFPSTFEQKQITLIVSQVIFTATYNKPFNIQEVFSSLQLVQSHKLSQYLHWAVSLNNNSCLLDLDVYNRSNETFKFFKTITSDAKFENIRFRRLDFRIKSNFAKGIITDVVKKHRIQYLQLRGDHDLNMADLCVNAGLSPYLTYLKLEDLIIDLYDLTNGGNKKYNRIEISDCIVTCRKPLLKRNCCHELITNDLEVIVQLEPEILLLCFRFFDEIDGISIHEKPCIEYLKNNFPNWTGFNTVKQLGICDLSEMTVELLSPWQNLEVLGISLDYKCNPDLIAGIIQNLQISKLVIDGEYSGQFNLITSMTNLWKIKRNIHLKTIHIEVGEFYHGNLQEFEKLVEGIELGHWDTMILTFIPRFEPCAPLLKLSSKFEVNINSKLFNQNETIFSGYNNLVYGAGMVYVSCTIRRKQSHV